MPDALKEQKERIQQILNETWDGTGPGQGPQEDPRDGGGRHAGGGILE